MGKNYANAYTEVCKILSYVPKEDIEKIPKDMIDNLEKNKNPEYEFNINPEQDLSEQEMLVETKAILANIFRDYWATPEQKEKIIAKQAQERKTYQDKLNQKYNIDSLFNRKEQIEFEDPKNLPMDFENLKWYQNLYYKLKRFIDLIIRK